VGARAVLDAVVLTVLLFRYTAILKYHCNTLYIFSMTVHKGLKEESVGNITSSGMA